MEELWEEGPSHVGCWFPEESLSPAPKWACIVPASRESGHTVTQTRAPPALSAPGTEQGQVAPHKAGLMPAFPTPGDLFVYLCLSLFIF